MILGLLGWALAIGTPPMTAAGGLIARTLPGRTNDFVCERIPSEKGQPTFEIAGRNGKVMLRGSDDVAVASAFNWYLKHVANCQVSTRGDQLRLTRPVPLPAETIRLVSPYRTVNYLNYCTFCYTAAFWGWPQWEREIDLLAMSGARNPLMVVGCEKVWQRVLQRLRYSKADIDAFIPSSAYTAWWLMGNLEGEGGPVPQPIVDRESELARKILARMRAYGMEPVLQGFCGVVPTTLPKYLPAAQVIEQGAWAGGYRRPSVLSPVDPKFGKVAALWYEESAKLYGKARYYGGDLFHEGGRTAGLDLGQCARAVQGAMRRANPDATWVLQGWQDNPKHALLTAVDPDHVLVEHLQSYPSEYQPMDFEGRPWTYTMINCFGGHESLGGSLKAIADIPSTLLDGSNNHLTGLGVLDEGLDTNPAVYDLASDILWERKPVDLKRWADEYARRRYGADDPDAARYWEIMASDLLGHESENLLLARPAFGIHSTSTWGDATLKHDPAKQVEACRHLLACASRFRSLPTYQCDCVDAMRQVMNDYGVGLYKELSEAYANRDLDRFTRSSNQFLGVLSDLDRLLSAGPNSLLGTWIAAARAKGRTPAERDLMERNARQLITLWSPKETDLSDYAYRNWGGLTRDYYLPRWRRFFENVARSIKAGTGKPTFDGVEDEVRWVRSTSPTYPVKPVANGADLASALFAKYGFETTRR